MTVGFRVSQGISNLLWSPFLRSLGQETISEEMFFLCNFLSDQTFQHLLLKIVISVFTVWGIFVPLSLKLNLLLIVTKQITTDCFVLIYNPHVYLLHVESIQVKKKTKHELLCWLFVQNSYPKCRSD